jgi:hypothetical protein
MPEPNAAIDTSQEPVDQIPPNPLESSTGAPTGDSSPREYPLLERLWELANDAQADWVRLSDTEITPTSEYWRGYMNAMHQAIGIIGRKT